MTHQETNGELLTDCLRYVVHDLNNPLTAMRLLVEFVRSDASSAELQGDLTDIHEAVDLLAALVDGLDSLSRQNEADAGRRAAVDLADLVRAVASRPAFARHVHLDLQGPLPIVGDPVALHRALTDVLANARRLADRHTVMVMGRAVPDAVELRVRHRITPVLGQGAAPIPTAERLAAVLHPFGSVLLRRQKMSVLATGLAYARRVVEDRHGGTIRFEDSEGGALDLVIAVKR